MNNPAAISPTPDFDLEAVFEVDDYMYFYGDLLTDELTDKQVGKLLAWLALTQPVTILDLACGYGRHANRLAGLGHHVTGIDFTPGFLEIARKDANRLGVDVAYQQGDMRQLDYHAAFDVVLLLFTAFGYFDDAQNADVLKRIGRALKPGGRLVFDTQNRDALWKGFLPESVSEKDGNLMIDIHRFDCLTGWLNTRRIVIRDGVRKEKPFFVRMYNATEMRLLLEQAGLEIEQIYGGWDGLELSGDTRRMVIVARKPLLSSTQE